MKLRVTVARLLLLPMLALGATAGALAADSPFAAFKKIVSLPETEREAAVGGFKISSERHRKLLQAKVREYAAMPEAERDRKLDALDFRWHLMPIMKTAKTDRAKRLASVPERFRTDIERRLTGWDKLEAGLRADLLKNESFFRYLSSFGRGRQSRVALTNHMEKMPTRLREGLEGRITTWREKSKLDRRRPPAWNRRRQEIVIVHAKEGHLAFIRGLPGHVACIISTDLKLLHHAGLEQATIHDPTGTLTKGESRGAALNPTKRGPPAKRGV